MATPYNPSGLCVDKSKRYKPSVRGVASCSTLEPCLSADTHPRTGRSQTETDRPWRIETHRQRENSDVPACGGGRSLSGSECSSTPPPVVISMRSSEERRASAAGTGSADCCRQRRLGVRGGPADTATTLLPRTTPGTRGDIQPADTLIAPLPTRAPDVNGRRLRTDTRSQLSIKTRYMNQVITPEGAHCDCNLRHCTDILVRRRTPGSRKGVLW